MAFKEVDIHTLQFNPFDKISKQWMLITAGEQEKSNTMTASWGGVGFMWGKPVATAYIRPQRYTKEFVDTNDRFTLSFLTEEKREALKICGSVSGRDVLGVRGCAQTAPLRCSGGRHFLGERTQRQTFSGDRGRLSAISRKDPADPARRGRRRTQGGPGLHLCSAVPGTG